MNDFRLDTQNYLILLTAFINLTFAAFIYIRGKAKKSNISYSIFTFGVVLWSIGMFMYRGTADHDLAVFWAKFLYFASGSIPISLLYFSFVFPQEVLKISRLKKFIIFGLPVLIILTSFIPNFVVKDIIIGRSIENEMVFGPGYNFWSFYLLLYFLWSFINLLKTYKKSSSIVKLQVKYILIGATIALVGGTITNLLLPAIGNTSFGWMGQSFTIIMVGFVSYAITHYRLMNIRLILTRSILYALLVGAVASFFALSVIVVGNAIGGNTQTSKVFTYIITSLIVVIFLDPVKRVWAKLTDKVFYKDKVDYQEVLREAGNVVAREIDLYKLLKGITKLLVERLKIKRVFVFTFNKGEFPFLLSVDKKIKKFSLSNDFVSYLKENKRILVIDELIRDLGILDEENEEYKKINIFIKEAESHNTEMIIPVIENDVITAILCFGAKQSGDLYGQDDINFLEVLAPQIGTAIAKSKLYQEVEEFNKELQQKVEDRTKSLREVNEALEERNKFLTTTQVVTNMISRTLDLKKVNQMIADSIATELGYVGGMLSFVDDSGKYLKVGAITNNEKTRHVFGLLSKEPREYRSELKDGFNKGVQTFLSTKTTYATKLSDFLSPPVAEEQIDKIQESLGIETIIGMPIFSEAKVIGVIQFYLPIKRGKISDLDHETMSSIANQVGIVSRNLKLYNTLQGANAELQDANTRLRELDKAKSEFLSIASHQLRTPISAIKGYLSMIIDGDFGKVPKNINNIVKQIFESSARLARLINIFLNVSRIESGRLKLDKKPIQINDLIEGVIIELINQAKQKGVKLEYKKNKKAPPLILADPDKLREVVLNLVDNSIKYTPEGAIIVTVESDDKELNFRVTDTGIGIKKDEVKSLFRKFVRGSGVAQVHTGGSGLGLFIAQKIIKEHNGQVWAESEGKGKGSVFQFTIPVYKEHDTPAYKEEAEEK